MNECTQYLLENYKEINLDKCINFMDFIDNKCFNDPIFVKKVYKYLISSENIKVCNYDIRRVVQCFTISQLKHIYTISDADNNISYDEVIIEIIRHHGNKNMVSYRYYLKYIINIVYNYTYILNNICKYARQIYDCFNINILPQLCDDSSTSPSTKPLEKLITSDISFKQIKNSVNKITENDSKLDVMIENTNFCGSRPVNILFLKYISKYLPDFLEKFVSKMFIYQYNLKTIIFAEKNTTTFKLTLPVSIIKLNCSTIHENHPKNFEYLIRSKKCHNNSAFNLVKKILEKFSTKNICKTILYF